MWDLPFFSLLALASFLVTGYRYLDLLINNFNFLFGYFLIINHCGLDIILDNYKHRWIDSFFSSPSGYSVMTIIIQILDITASKCTFLMLIHYSRNIGKSLLKLLDGGRIWLNFLTNSQNIYLNIFKSIISLSTPFNTLSSISSILELLKSTSQLVGRT